MECQKIMAAPKEFRWGREGSPPQLGVHSEAKLRVFRNYLSRYLDILTQPRRRRELRLTIVDGFAGGGYFQFGDQVVSGSPLMVLEELEAAQIRINQGRENPVKIAAQLHFVDSNKYNLSALRRCLWDRGYGPRIGSNITLHKGEFASVQNTILENIRRWSPRAGRSIFLLDQTGYTGIGLHAAREILGKFDRAEILMTWAVDWLIDFLHDGSDFSKAAMGTNIDHTQLRELLRLKDQKHARYIIQNRLAQHLRTELGNPYFTVFFIKPADSHRALWLVHASKHPTARDAMIRTHWEIANASISHGPDAYGILGFAPGDESTLPLPLEFDAAARLRTEAALKRDLAPVVREAFGNEEVPLVQVRDSVLNAGVMATTEHFDQAVLSAAADNEVRVLTSSGRLKRAGAQLTATDRLLIPETPPLLSLMGLDLPKM